MAPPQKRVPGSRAQPERAESMQSTGGAQERHAHLEGLPGHCWAPGRALPPPRGLAQPQHAPLQGHTVSRNHPFVSQCCLCKLQPDRDGGTLAELQPNSSCSSQCRTLLRTCRALRDLHRCGVNSRAHHNIVSQVRQVIVTTSSASSALPRCSVSRDRRTHHCPRRPWQHSPPAAARAKL